MASLKKPLKEASVENSQTAANAKSKIIDSQTKDVNKSIRTRKTPKAPAGVAPVLGVRRRPYQ